MATEKILKRQMLEKALYDYVMNEDNNVKTDDDLPSASKLRRAIIQAGDYIRYIEVRKFLIAKKNAGQLTVEAIKSGKGKIVKNENVPPKEEEKEEEEKEEEPKGNLLQETVKEVAKEEIEKKKKEEEEARKKAEEATPSQEAEVGPVTVTDDAFDNIDVSEETIEAKRKEKEEQKEKETFVTRQEIRKMSDEEVDRFFNAVDTMMKAKNGPGSSEFFRLAVKCRMYLYVI